MGQTWQLQQAKNKFSAVVKAAEKGEPQIITRHGEEVVILLSIEQYKKLTNKELSNSEFFTKSPLAGIGIDLTRDKSLPRDPIQL